MTQMRAWRLDQTPWKSRNHPVNDAPYFSSRLMQDAETGIEAIMVHYPAGSVTPAHDHPCGHGLVVISGKLVTQDGNFGPGDVVWYPEGAVGTHGAAADGPVTALLFTNKVFGIRFTGFTK